MDGNVNAIVTRGYLFNVPLVVTEGYGTNASPPISTGSGQNKQFIGEIQSLGFGSILDASTGLT